RPCWHFWTVFGFSVLSLSWGRSSRSVFVNSGKEKAPLRSGLKTATVWDYIMKTFVKCGIVVLLVLGALREFSLAQTDSPGYLIATPRPINPAASTTNPSALATQSQNPYLGSTLSGK